MYLTMLAGPLFIALAGILVIALAYGRVGLRDLRSRLFTVAGGRSLVRGRTADRPALGWTAILGAFSLTSKAFLPAIVTAEDKASLLVAGLVAGLVRSPASSRRSAGRGSLLHELRKRHGVLATGLIVGLPWCVLHVPLYAGTASGAVPPAL